MTETNELPTVARQALDNPEADIDNVRSYECNSCHFHDYEVTQDGETTYVDDDGETGRTYMTGLEDDYSHFYHVNPDETTYWICEQCSDSIRYDADEVITAQGEGSVGRVLYNDGYVIVDPVRDGSIDDWDDRLKTARDTHLAGETPEYDGREMVTVRSEPGFREALSSGDIRGVPAIVDRGDVIIPQTFTETYEYLHDLFDSGVIPE